MEQIVNSVPVLGSLVATLAACIVWAIRLEGKLTSAIGQIRDVKRDLDSKFDDLRKVGEKRHEELQGELIDKLTYYATTTELSEVRGQVLVAVSQLSDLKPMLVRLEGKIDAFLIASVQQDHQNNQNKGLKS